MITKPSISVNGVLIVLFVFFISGCTFFFSPLHGRENADDPAAQIYNLMAVQTGQNEVTASFTWRKALFNYDREEEITETVLVYNIGEALPVRSIPLPPDSGGSVGYERDEGRYSYSKTVEGVDEGDTLWFALYPRTDRRWLAPLYESIKVQDTSSFIPQGPLVAGVTDAFSGNIFGQVFAVEAGNTYPLFNDGSNEDFIILRFDIPKRIMCTEAFLFLPTGVGNTARAYPLIFPHVNGMQSSDVLQLIDESVSASFPLDASVNGAGAGNAEITAVINKAVLYESNTIIIRPDPGTNINPNYGSEDVNISYIQY